LLKKGDVVLGVLKMLTRLRTKDARLGSKKRGKVG